MTLVPRNHKYHTILLSEKKSHSTMYIFGHISKKALKVAK